MTTTPADEAARKAAEQQAVQGMADGMLGPSK